MTQRPFKIITLVREPILRDLSSYFEGIMLLDKEFLVPYFEERVSPLLNTRAYFQYIYEAKDKLYHHAYKQLFRNIQLPKDYIDFYYKDNVYMNHFYDTDMGKEVK